jgi:hypothetical protein
MKNKLSDLDKIKGSMVLDGAAIRTIKDLIDAWGPTNEVAPEDVRELGMQLGMSPDTLPNEADIQLWKAEWGEE